MLLAAMVAKTTLEVESESCSARVSEQTAPAALGGI